MYNSDGRFAHSRCCLSWIGIPDSTASGLEREPYFYCSTDRAGSQGLLHSHHVRCSSCSLQRNQVEYAIELLQFPALTCTKLSLLFFYKRIFCTPWRRLLRAVFIVLIVICVLWGFGFFGAMAFICGRRVPAFWGPVQDIKAHCPGLHEQEIWLVSTDVFIDILIFLIPIPLVLQIEMAFTRKIAVSIIFLFAAM